MSDIEALSALPSREVLLGKPSFSNERYPNFGCTGARCRAEKSGQRLAGCQRTERKGSSVISMIKDLAIFNTAFTNNFGGFLTWQI